MVKASVLIGGASPDHARKASDFYATPREATVALLDWWRPEVRHGVVAWEPACGDGAMARVIETRAACCVCTDLRSTGVGTGGIDFLTYEPRFGFDWIATNPPFSHAEAFIRRARSFAKPFAMLLKATYWHAASRAALLRETGPAAVLPLTWRPNFAPERGDSPTMDVLWTVWDAAPQATPPIYAPLTRP